MNQYQAGQVWSYKTRQHESDSLLTILKVDLTEQGKVIHVAVEGVQIPHAAGVAEAVEHLPFTEEALSQSLVRLQGIHAEPLNLYGYNEWQEAFSSGEAGVFDFSVAEALEWVEQSLLHNNSSLQA